VTTRDYLTVKLWDTHMNRGPVTKFNVQEHLKDSMYELYESESVFDKFGIAESPDSELFVSGSYRYVVRGINELIALSVILFCPPGYVANGCRCAVISSRSCGSRRASRRGCSCRRPCPARCRRRGPTCPSTASSRGKYPSTVPERTSLCAQIRRCVAIRGWLAASVYIAYVMCARGNIACCGPHRGGCIILYGCCRCCIVRGIHMRTPSRWRARRGCTCTSYSRGLYIRCA
jgi:hypothetical protein